MKPRCVRGFSYTGRRFIKVCNKAILDFTEFLNESPSVFHVVHALAERLEEAGFVRLSETMPAWDLTPGGNYFVTRNDSAMISFRLPEKKTEILRILAGHSDSPTFKIKPDPEIASAGCVKLNIEPYGGMLKSTWYDRPLTVAGRVLTDDGGSISQKLVYVDEDLLMIPSLAIHMDREANEKSLTNVQTDMQPLFALGEKGDRFMERIAAAAGITAKETEGIAGKPSDQILGMDLFLVNRQKPFVWGPDGEFISAAKLDDLMCVYGTFAGFAAAAPSENVLSMHCVFDNEEVGSRSKQGAESTFLSDCLVRIRESLGMTFSEMHAAAQRGMMISADNAHAVHPNHTDKADPVNRPQMNGGIVLKFHAGQLYTTDGVSAAFVKKLCLAQEIPLQTFVNRSDMRGGSTLGSIANTQLSMNTADIGLAQLAMHSSCETAGTKDLAYLVQFAQKFCE